MFDPKSLLDQFLGAGGGLPGQQGGSTPGLPSAIGAGGASDLLQQGQQLLGGQGGSLATGALAGGAMGLLLGSKKGRKLGKSAVKYGGLALVGALAYKAYRGYQQRQAGAGDAAVPPAAAASGVSVPAAGVSRTAPVTELLPPPSDTPFAPEKAPGGAESFSLVVLRAMIAAAKADGHVDADEQRRIFERLDELGIGAEERAFVFQELSAPLDIEALVSEARTPEAAAEIYAASLLAIRPDGPAERAYLDLLRTRLQIPPELAEELHAAVAEAEEA